MKTRGQGVIRQCYLENGNISSEFVETDAYSYDETEGVYYMDTSVLKARDVLYKTDSQETYTVSKRATLIGVYNVNIRDMLTSSRSIFCIRMTSIPS